MKELIEQMKKDIAPEKAALEKAITELIVAFEDEVGIDICSLSFDGSVYQRHLGGGVYKIRNATVTVNIQISL